MAKHFDDQIYENAILYQHVELFFKPAENWETCLLPLTNDEMIAKIFEEIGIYFQGNPILVTKILEDLKFIYSFNEHNGKRYWLINPA